MIELDTEFPQETENNEYRYISPAWLDAIAEGLTNGQRKYPGETWRQIPSAEHLARAMRHINLYRMGDRTEPHIINASMRLMMEKTRHNILIHRKFSLALLLQKFYTFQVLLTFRQS